MNNAATLAGELAKMRAADVIRNEAVRAQFIAVYNSIWKEGGEAAYEREALYFNQQIREKQPLQACSAVSVFYAFIDLAVKGLSLAPGAQALCYLIPRSTKLTAGGKEYWEKTCSLTISGYGELTLRRAAGQIRHADNPVLVYEGDTFQYGEQNGQKIVNYMSAFPRKSNRIIACFLKITRADGTIDYSVMTEQDWMRLKTYSDRNNTYKDRNGNEVTRSNELYSSADGQIDPGFLMAKCVKHAFKSYPKLNIGRGSTLESEIDSQPAAEFDPYAGISDEVQLPQPEVAEAPQTYAPAPDLSSGVTVTAADDDVF